MMLNNNLAQPLPLTTWPPPYTLRYSTRAKHANLRIHPAIGLEVIIPFRRKNFDVPRLLTEKRAWIEKHWLIINAANNEVKPELPANIFITNDKQLWKIIYHDQVSKKSTAPADEAQTSNYLKLTVHENLNLLVFSGNIKFELVRKKLLAWLRHYAQISLAKKLQAVSLHTKLGYNKLAIRSQSTVWGSCNNKKHISLNLKLLFLPTALTDYVLLHELCHTKYLNHGQKFWQLVYSFNSDYKFLEKHLKHGDKYLPGWLSKHIS